MRRVLAAAALMILGLAIVMSGQTKVKLGTVPAAAQIIYHNQNLIWVMNADGTGRTQITFDNTRQYEHAALSPDRKFIAANYFVNGVSHATLFNLQNSTETPIAASFPMAGNGGVDWDTQGRIYFAGVQALPYPNPTTPEQSMANAGANDIWRIKYDGTGLTRITNTADRAEADVSVHPGGSLITYIAVNLGNNLNELWVKDTAAGGGQMLVYTSADGDHGVQDPEHSPDGQQLVFSMHNPDYHNFPEIPGANTAHDIYRINIDGTGLTRLTAVGPISMIPDWKGTKIIYHFGSSYEVPPWTGMVIMNQDGTLPVRLNDVSSPKWIP